MRIVMDQSTDAIVLTEASVTDIPSLVRIYLAAFARDNAARLMFKNEDHWRENLQVMLQSDLSNPEGSLIKAISKDTGDTFGWLGFGVVGYPVFDGKGAVPWIVHAVPPTKSENKIFSAIRKDFTRMRNEWMSNKQYIHIGILVTDPAHQRQGVGSALIRYATSKADLDGVPCWIESSPAAHNVIITQVLETLDHWSLI